MKTNPRVLLGGLMRHLILILVSAFALLPLLWMLSTSLKPETEVYTNLSIIPRQLDFSSYAHVWGQTEFPLWFRNSAVIALSSTTLALVIGCLAAYSLSRFRYPGRTLFGQILLIVQMFPSILLVIPMFLIMSKVNLLDRLSGLIITYLAFGLPTATWMLKGYFDTIPKELEEAAMIDGCSTLSAFRRVILPISGPGITSVAIFTLLLAWNEFLYAFIFLKSSKNFTLTLGLVSFMNQFTNEWDNLMTASTLITVPVLFFFLLLQKYLTRGLIAGATKG
ncbi:MAG: carbohydrate ABC transporter permease [Firmicutes bacterium]|nr:carbohydrate ABC transporter permease [Bacillota bacterium]